MTNNTATILNVRDITVSIAGHAIVEHASFKVGGRDIVTLIGPNGAGKTTLVRVALGLLAPQKGVVYRDPRKRISYMPQRLHLDNTMPISVERFLSLNMDAKPGEAQLRRALAMVKAEPVLKLPLQKISGGELQRVLLARCILRKPDLLVLDEPTQGVDISGQEELYDIIKHIRDTFACGVLMVSHDLHLVMAATDQVICLNRHICCTGNPESIRQHPEFLAMFGDSTHNLAVYSHHHDHQHDAHGNIVPDSEQP